MALGSRTIFQANLGSGSDSNGGGFNPANANFATDLACDTGTGNTATPVVSSASYNFAAGDVGAWLFVQSGTNWTPGWYKISSVAANKATLDGAIGNAILYAGGVPTGINAAAGIGTTATPTSGKWGIDYSQTDAARIPFSDMVIGATTTQFTSSGNPVGKNYIGNLIRITSGTGFTVQTVEVVSTSGTTATCDKSLGTAASSGGNGNLGGAMLTWAQAESVRVANNGLFLKAGTYSISTGITLASTGNTLPNATPDYTIGFTSKRFDGGKVTITASAAITMVSITVPNTKIENVDLDGNSNASICWNAAASNQSRGFVLTNCGALNFTSKGINASGGVYVRPYIRTAVSGATAGFFLNNGCVIVYPEIDCPNCHGVSTSGSGTSLTTIVGGAIYQDNGVASKCAIVASDAIETLVLIGVTFHTSTGDLIQLTGSYQSLVAINNIIYGSGANGLNCGVVRPPSGSIDYNAFGGNTTANRVGVSAGPHDVTLTGDPCVSMTTGNLALNATAGAGAACRAAALPPLSPRGATASYEDIGGFQHQDSGGGTAAGHIIGAAT